MPPSSRNTREKSQRPSRLPASWSWLCCPQRKVKTKTRTRTRRRRKVTRYLASPPPFILHPELLRQTFSGCQSPPLHCIQTVWPLLCPRSPQTTRSWVCWKLCSESETGTTPKALWTRCHLSMLLLTRPLHWHFASWCTWLWSLFTEGADFFVSHPPTPLFFFSLVVLVLLKHVLMSQLWLHNISVSLKVNTHETWKKRKQAASKMFTCFVLFFQGWSPQRSKRTCSAPTEEQRGPSACRDLRGPPQGHVQHVGLPGPPPVQRPHPLCQGRASGQSFHEGGKKKQEYSGAAALTGWKRKTSRAEFLPDVFVPRFAWTHVCFFLSLLSSKTTTALMSETKWWG